MKLSHSSLISIVFLSSSFIISITSGCNLKKAGQNAAEAVSGSAERSARELSYALRETSATLSQAIDKGVEETATTVRELADSISKIAQSVDVRIDSGDLSNIGEAATNNIKQALVELSSNWDLAVNTADLKEVGADAAEHLSRAIQNINLKLQVRIEIDDNVVTAIGYLSIAGGIAFSVLFIAILISLRSCRSCMHSLCTLCITSCKHSPTDVRISMENVGQKNKETVELENLLKSKGRKTSSSNLDNINNLNIRIPEKNNDCYSQQGNRTSDTLANYSIAPIKQFWEKNQLYE